MLWTQSEISHFFLLKWHFINGMMRFLCPEISTRQLFFTNAFMCFCYTGDRFCVFSHFAVNHHESVNQKNLSHLFATKANLCSAGRRRQREAKHWAFSRLSSPKNIALYSRLEGSKASWHIISSFCTLLQAVPMASILFASAPWGTLEMGPFP